MTNALRSVKARDLLGLTPVDILRNIDPYVNVIYDDNQVVQSTNKKLAYSWFIWEFHRRYPFLPLLHEHHVNSELKNGSLTSNTHKDLIGKIFKQLVLDYGMSGDEQKEELQTLIYNVVNELHNEMPKLASANVMTLDILDILQLANDPDVLELKDKLEPRAGAIEDFYVAAHRILFRKPEYSQNNLIKYLKAELLNKNQVNQCILARGFPIEVTGTILSKAILTCYATGMYKLYDYVGDSRGASKHLYAAEAPLQQAEYFARRLQLAGMVITGISKTDCGSTEYLTWYVKPEQRNASGRVLQSSDLRYLKGKHYLDEGSNQLKIIEGNEHHLSGKTIRLRSVLFCKELNAHKVCPTCFGLLHHNVSRFANLGHLCDASLTQQLTQTLLSTKHHIASAIGAEILLGEEARRLLDFSYPTMSFVMKPMNPKSQYKLFVNRGEAIGITDLRLLSNLDTITPRRISSLASITIQETTPNGAVSEVVVKIEQNKRFGYFSHEFLAFLKTKSWTTNENEFFVFDLTGWDHRNPLVRVPDMEYSYSDHVDRIADLIESKAKSLNGRLRPGTPVELLQDLFDSTNSKIHVNISLLEVMVYAMMTPGPDDFGLARGAKNPVINLARTIITNRSLSAAYAYEDQFDTITNPRSFFPQNRPDSPMDALIAPREVVARIHQLKDTAHYQVAQSML